MTRARFHEYAECEAGQGQNINISFECPYNMILTCVKAKWSAVPTTSEFFTVEKSNVLEAQGEVVLLEEDPSVVPPAGLTEYMNTDNIELKKGDVVTITYANTDDLTCNAEMILEQV